MRISVPIIVKDPEVTQYHDLPSVERVTVEEECFLDGPVSERAAVVDFDERDGRLRPGARFVARDGGQGGRFELPSGADPATVDPATAEPAFTALSVFGTVFKVLGLAEDADALGRRVRWGFDGPQLLLVPRAGDWRNAFYQRESRSLQFFSFTAGGTRVHTAHSQDIVAHETAHAVLDGIAPDLYDATLPESLAIHEAVADLTAVLCAFRSRGLAQYVLAREPNASIARTRAFSGLAEQFQGELGGRLYLRDLLNERRLADVDPVEPHALSEVLSGALYKLTLQLYESLRTDAPDAARNRPAPAPGEAERQEAADRHYWTMQAAAPPAAPVDLQAAQKALWLAGERLKRLLFRGLDYLPPGEAGFADFGRALLAADAASHPESAAQREWLANELVQRGIVGAAAELESPIEPAVARAVAELDLEALLESDWAAYEFVNRRRGPLGIPDGPFRIWPRLRVRKRYYHEGSGPVEREECLLKVGWSDVEDNPGSPGGTTRRRATGGLTLAIDLEDRRVRAQLRTGRSTANERARTAFLARLFDDGRLAPAAGRAGRRGTGGPYCEVRNGVLRVRATAALLDTAEE